MTIFHHLQFRATLTTILHTSQNLHVLHISRFLQIDTARRRERTSEMDLAKTPSRAGEMRFFDLDHNFSPRGLSDFPPAPTRATDLHQMLFYYRKNPIVWPHCLGKKDQPGQGRRLNSTRQPTPGVWGLKMTIVMMGLAQPNFRWFRKLRYITNIFILSSATLRNVHTGSYKYDMLTLI